VLEYAGAGYFKLRARARCRVRRVDRALASVRPGDLIAARDSPLLVAAPSRSSGRVLVLDIGGTHVKLAFSDHRTEIKVPSGTNLTPRKMLRKVAPCLRGQRYDVVSIGYPGLVVHGRIVREPHNLGPGWVGFDFERALRHPVRVVNDAVMQALGGYHGRRMLFLGLGTGLGTAMIVDGILEPMELAHLPYKKDRTYEEYVGEAGLERLGRKKWQKEVFEVVATLSAALEPDYVRIGGGNARRLKALPRHCERGDNRDAVLGGIRLWSGGASPGRPRRRPRRSAPRADGRRNSRGRRTV
jgi:glucose-6-phosphate isomerase